MDLLRAHDVAAVIADGGEHPRIADVTASFVYARLQSASEASAQGYSDEALDRWAGRARLWAQGRQPGDLAPVAAAPPEAPGGREVFVYMINEFKPKAPAAAMALIERLGASA